MIVTKAWFILLQHAAVAAAYRTQYIFNLIQLFIRPKSRFDPEIMEKLNFYMGFFFNKFTFIHCSSLMHNIKQLVDSKKYFKS